MSPAADAPSALRRAAPFAALLLLLVAAHAVLETARDGLFLSAQPVGRLPFLYLAVTAAVLALTPLQRRLWDGRGRLALPVTLGAAGGVTLAFWAGIHSPLAIDAFYVWTALFSSIVFVQFWLAADEGFGVGEAKQVFGIIAAGGLVGALAGSSLARLLLDAMAAQLLLAVSAGMTFLGAGLAFWIARPTCDEPALQPEVAVVRAVPTWLRDDPYLRILAVVSVLTALTATFTDYLFKAAISTSVDPAHIPRLVANVYVGQSALALLVELLVVRAVLRSSGVTRSLALLPGVVLLGATGFALGGGLAVLLGLRILDAGLRPSIYRVSTELLYLPVPAAERRLVKPSIDTVGQRGGQALASLVLLVVAALGDARALGVVTVLLAVAAVAWLVATRALRRRYLRRFQEQLGRGSVDGSMRSLDLASAEVLVGALGSPDAREVLTALALLADHGRLRLVPALVLYHPDAAVVRAALARFERVHRPDVDALLPYLARHPDPDVRAGAARRWLGAGQPEDGLSAFASDPSPRVRATRLVALVTERQDPGATAELERIAREGAPDERRGLAAAFADAARPVFLPVFRPLFDGGDVETRRQLLRAVARLAEPPRMLLEPLIPLLADPGLRSEARDALLAFGDAARERLTTLLLADDTPFRLARELPAALARFPAGAAAPALLARVAQPRGGLDRYRSLRALNQLRRTTPRLALDDGLLALALDVDLSAAFRNRALRVAALGLDVGARPEDTAGTLLVELLRDREALAMERAFRVLHLLYPRGRLEQVYLGARSERPERRDAAREVLTELLRPPWRERALALLVPDAPDPAPGRDDAPLPLLEDRAALVAALEGQHSETVRLLSAALVARGVGGGRGADAGPVAPAPSAAGPSPGGREVSLGR